jgi:hypothetical protein
MYLLNQCGPVSSIITGIENPSRNPKTGPMAQVWHIRNDMHPLDAARTGADEAICGQCPLRGLNGKKRICYVTLGFAPAQVYKGLPTAKPVSMRLLHNRSVRWGAYGDTALSLPIETVADINKRVAMWTGYTHQWKTCDPEFKKYLMASCDSEQDYNEAKEAGWRTFRAKVSTQSKLAGERVCPAGTNGITCMTCGMCNGLAGSRKKDIVIDVHGQGARYVEVSV